VKIWREPPSCDTNAIRSSEGDQSPICASWRRRLVSCTGLDPSLSATQASAYPLRDDENEFPVVLRGDIVHYDDIGMAQPGGRSRLPKKLIPAFWIADVRQGLDGDSPVQARVEGVVDDSHSTGADLLEDLIARPDFSAHSTLPPRVPCRGYVKYCTTGVSRENL